MVSRLSVQLTMCFHGKGHSTGFVYGDFFSAAGQGCEAGRLLKKVTRKKSEVLLFFKKKKNSSGDDYEEVSEY